MGVSYETSDAKIRQLFALYMQLRQAGYSSQTAWNRVTPGAQTLPSREQERLANMLHGWEAKDGRHYPSHEDNHNTMHVDKAAVQQAQQQHIQQHMQQQSQQQAPRPKGTTLLRRLIPGVNAPQDNTPAPVACPHCGKPNNPSEPYCYSCGELLFSPPVNTRQLTDAQAAHIEDEAYFGPGSVLFMQVRGHDRMVEVKINGRQVVIGRSSPNSAMLPDVDLAAFEAAALGVSRMHAELKREQNTLLLSDLGSANHTHINGQRLHAHEVRVLNNGDVIEFGRLMVRLHFRHT
ncbi:MAG: FHA domain-containing protein [Anaerolineae bacterium]|nr:FHA domain-containing protein [Anaerolineae bacterium]